MTNNETVADVLAEMRAWGSGEGCFDDNPEGKPELTVYYPKASWNRLCDRIERALAAQPSAAPAYDRDLIAEMLEHPTRFDGEEIVEQAILIRNAAAAEGGARTVSLAEPAKASGSAPGEIDTESADFKEGFAVGRAESEHLCEMIKNPTCHRCGATSAKDAETKCRPGGMGGDECPGTEWPLSKLWATPPASAPKGCDLAAEAIAYHNAVGALDCLSAAFSAMDNSDTEVEKWPQRAIDALACAGWAVVPCDLPFEVLGEAAMIGAFETGNPKHGWDFLLSKTRIGPHGEPKRASAPNDQWAVGRESEDYDHSIHCNPDADAWAAFFVETYPRLVEKRDIMRGWFANAMMAMADHIHASAPEVTPDILRIPAGDKLDTIVVYFEDEAVGKGRMTVVCYGDAWIAHMVLQNGQSVIEHVTETKLLPGPSA